MDERTASQGDESECRQPPRNVATSEGAKRYVGPRLKSTNSTSCSFKHEERTVSGEKETGKMYADQEAAKVQVTVRRQQSSDDTPRGRSKPQTQGRNKKDQKSSI